MHQSAMESPGSNSEQGSSARVIQETPNSHSDQSSVSYKDWKRPDRSVQSSSLPRGVSTVRCKMALKLCYRTPGRLVTSREKHLLLLSHTCRCHPLLDASTELERPSRHSYKLMADPTNAVGRVLR